MIRLKPRHFEQELTYASGNTPRTLKGARQFWTFESTGEEPTRDDADPYYHDLRHGKMDNCLSVTHMADSYGGQFEDKDVGGWFGWMYINLAFCDEFIAELISALQKRGWNTDMMDTTGSLSPDEKRAAQDKHATAHRKLSLHLRQGQ